MESAQRATTIIGQITKMYMSKSRVWADDICHQNFWGGHQDTEIFAICSKKEVENQQKSGAKFSNLTVKAAKC